ncbi:SDR family oxidoreductase [Mycolicibacillus parakoreensis]|uniref:SDR family oxidoreductase n=1 Tax=Mycolicibacillus parakoreensis TaxID=1069221 RepID=A0ABY3U011_9MYCO|nr:SDR family oxidoreductase [Mycolicibacillus parakoreensis]MCV7315573.1 SDR family oxidoreductase [Mycolicibacillus parakoreensis]ULN51981.1 SDR family oxidoreductase [Mycolicibacillus parakoreensis]
MRLDGRTAVVTGAGGGIGAAIATALADRHARVVVADLDEAAARHTTAAITARHPQAAVAVAGDVADPAVITTLIDTAARTFGPVELYFANAGVMGAPGLADDAAWDRVLEVNVRAHIRAARQLVPGWVQRGEGYFITTASAAGLLTQIGAAGYAVSKHAAVGFAEWLAVTYGDRGVRVSCLCPMGVDTAMLDVGDSQADPRSATAIRAVTAAGAVLGADQVAREVLAAIERERFLILPHPEVAAMFAQKASDYDRWLRGMRRYRASLQTIGDRTGGHRE